jgi:hypothetical protein
MITLQQAQSAPVVAMAFIENELWSASANLIFIYDERFDLVRTLSLDVNAPVCCMLLAPFSDYLLVFLGLHGKLVVLDAVSKTVLHTLSLPAGHVTSLVQMSQNVVLSGDNLGNVVKWPLA